MDILLIRMWADKYEESSINTDILRWIISTFTDGIITHNNITTNTDNFGIFSTRYNDDDDSNDDGYGSGDYHGTFYNEQVSFGSGEHNAGSGNGSGSGIDSVWNVISESNRCGNGDYTIDDGGYPTELSDDDD